MRKLLVKIWEYLVKIWHWIWSWAKRIYGTKATEVLYWLLRGVANALVAGTVGALIVGFILQRAAEVGGIRQETAIALNRAAVLARDRIDPQAELPADIRKRFEKELDEGFFLLHRRLPENLHACLERLVNRIRLRRERIVNEADWWRAFDKDSAHYSVLIDDWARWWWVAYVPLVKKDSEDQTCGFE